MNPDSDCLPAAGTLRVGPAPFIRGLPGMLPIAMSFSTASAVVMAAGVVLFGWQAVRVAAISVAAALLLESVFNTLSGRSRSWSESHALVVGILLACTLPPTVSWRVPVTGALIAVLVGQAMSGGLGNYLWHPVALGRVFVQVLYHDELTPDRWPVLARGRLLWGDLAMAEPLPPLVTWASSPPPPGVQAWTVIPPLERLRAVLAPEPGQDPGSALVVLIRDLLPPWWDTLTGTAGGAIGEACGLAVIGAGLLLAWRGFLRWRMVAGAVLAAGIAAAVLPVQVRGEAGMQALWFPGLMVSDRVPVGAAWVASHLTAGALLFVIFVLAPDPSSSPLTSWGHLVFGAVLGALTVLLRVVAGIPADACWALLAANTLVPLIDRLTRRRVLGT